MKILIAEDDVMSQVMLKATVAKAGYEPVITGDGLSAYEILLKPDAPKLAVLDWMMPGMDGVEVCRKVREINTNEPPYLILLTSRDNREDIVHGLKSGANDYIVKPYDVEELKV
ncbi:MAG: response regulator transcription factor, partial [Verrucomicrobia bacterium]|nr:response regulator transcription factor [Verrucomicrobiota bacterium]